MYRNIMMWQTYGFKQPGIYLSRKLMLLTPVIFFLWGTSDPTSLSPTCLSPLPLSLCTATGSPQFACIVPRWSCSAACPWSTFIVQPVNLPGSAFLYVPHLVTFTSWHTAEGKSCGFFIFTFLTSTTSGSQKDPLNKYTDFIDNSREKMNKVISKILLTMNYFKYLWFYIEIFDMLNVLKGDCPKLTTRQPCWFGLN